jgi:hypothetical protein
MTTASIQYQQQEFRYQVDSGRTIAEKPRRSRRSSYARRNSRALALLGLARRRVRRWNW